MKTLFVISGLAFTALSSQAFAAESFDPVTVGEKIYKQAFGRGCGTCHDVSPTPNLIKNINDGTLDEKKLKEVVTEGRGTMPKAMKAIMDVPMVGKAGYNENQAIDALYKYLKHQK